MSPSTLTLIVSTMSLRYNKRYKLFVAEASDLDMGNPPDRILVESHATGQRKLFERISTQRDHEGEITSWDYTHADLRLRIFND